MKKIYLLIIFIFVLSSCESAKNALTLKKKPATDEFLVEKKSPLVMPPDYGKLPKPYEDNKNQETGKQSNPKDIKNLLSNNENTLSPKKKSPPSSLEKSILEKMN